MAVVNRIRSEVHGIEITSWGSQVPGVDIHIYRYKYYKRLNSDTTITGELRYTVTTRLRGVLKSLHSITCLFSTLVRKYPRWMVVPL